MVVGWKGRKEEDEARCLPWNADAEDDGVKNADMGEKMKKGSLSAPESEHAKLLTFESF